MSYDTLERQIHMLPEDYHEETSHYIKYAFNRARTQNCKKNNVDTSGLYGALKEMPDGLDIQKELRNEWI